MRARFRKFSQTLPKLYVRIHQNKLPPAQALPAAYSLKRPPHELRAAPGQGSALMGTTREAGRSKPFQPSEVLLHVGVAVSSGHCKNPNPLT